MNIPEGYFDIPCGGTVKWCNNGSTYMMWLYNGLCSYVGIENTDKFHQFTEEMQQQALAWAAETTRDEEHFEGVGCIVGGSIMLGLSVAYLLRKARYQRNISEDRQQLLESNPFDYKQETIDRQNSVYSSFGTCLGLFSAAASAAAGVGLVAVGSSILGYCKD